MDFTKREEQYGSNFKAPPKMTPYWRLFLNALEDFMLRFLLVCACVQLAIEVGFAEPDKRSMGKSFMIPHLSSARLLGLICSNSPFLLYSLD